MKELPPAFRVLESGGDLLEQLSQAFADRHGWIQATGFVDDIELRSSGTNSEVRRAFPGQFTLVALGGPLGGPYGATLSRLENGGVAVLAGMWCALARARSPPYASVRARREWRRPCRRCGHQFRHVPHPARPPGGSHFASRVGAAAALSDEEDAAGSESPERGDWFNTSRSAL